MAMIAIAMLLQALPAVPQLPAQRPKLVCREGEAVTGTHQRTGKRCKTAEEWQEEDSKFDHRPPALRIVKGVEDGIPPASPR